LPLIDEKPKLCITLFPGGLPLLLTVVAVVFVVVEVLVFLFVIILA
jgi:hypothetical protein